MKAPNQPHSMATALASSASLKLLSQLISWSVTIYALRTLSPNDYGVMATVTALVGLLLPFADNPLIISLARKRSLNDVFLRKYLYYCRFTSLLIALGGIVLAGGYAIAFSNLLVFEVACFSGISCLILGMKTVPEALLIRSQRVTTRALGIFIEAIVNSVLTLVLVASGVGVFSLAISPMIGLAVKTLFFRSQVGKLRSLVCNMRRLRKLLKWTFVGSVNETVLVLGGSAPILVVGFILPPHLLGVFSTALYLVMVLIGKIMQVINPTLISFISKNVVSVSEAARRIARGTGYIFGLGAPLFAGLALVSNDFVDVVLGQKWHQAGPIIAVIGIVMPIRLLLEFFCTSLRARGQEKLLFFIQLAYLIPSCLGTAIGATSGLMGAAIGFAVGYGVFAPIGILISAMVLQVSLGAVLRAVQWPIVGVACLVVTLFFVQASIQSLSPVMRLISLTCLGAAIFAPFAWMTHRHLRSDAPSSDASIPNNFELEDLKPEPLRRIGTVRQQSRVSTLSILTFHRVIDRPLFMERMHPSKDSFATLLRNLSQQFEFVSLDQGLAHLGSGTARRNLASITFDDGYKDNLAVAAPVLHDLKIPATMFCSTSHLDGKPFFVEVIVQSLMVAKPKAIDGEMFGLGRMKIDSLEQLSMVAERILNKAKYMCPEKRDYAVAEFWRNLGSPELPEVMINKAGIRELANSSFEIGSHTHSHVILNTVEESFVRSDIERNCELITEATGKPVRYFAYPNGKPSLDFSKRHTSLLQGMGFAAAFNSENAICTAKFDRFNIPRCGVSTEKPWLSTFKHRVRVLQSAYS